MAFRAVIVRNEAEAIIGGGPGGGAVAGRRCGSVFERRFTSRHMAERLCSACMPYYWL